MPIHSTHSTHSLCVVASMYARNQLEKLVQLPYNSYLNEVKTILLGLARGCDLAGVVLEDRTTYYEVLYSIFIFQHDYRTAAASMAELAEHLNVSPRLVERGWNGESACVLGLVSCIECLRRTCFIDCLPAQVLQLHACMCGFFLLACLFCFVCLCTSADAAQADQRGRNSARAVLSPGIAQRVDCKPPHPPLQLYDSPLPCTCACLLLSRCVSL